MAIYMWREEEIFNTPGIYHNEAEGLISLSSDGENWTTIADKNLGATQVWNDGDELTQENCWWFFQWGNNYMFPRTWPVNTTTTQINASEYWPSNYYSSDTFFYWQEDWDSSVNNDLWWYTTWTNEARQWPCQSWFHVPVHTEFGDIWRILKSFNRWWASYWKSLLFMPNAWSISRSSWTYSSSSYIQLWSCWSPQNTFDINTFSSNSVSQQALTYLVAKRASGYAIRPFKNEPVVPTSERTVLYQPN